jgi:hypothetical protein
MRHPTRRGRPLANVRAIAWPAAAFLVAALLAGIATANTPRRAARPATGTRPVARAVTDRARVIRSALAGGGAELAPIAVTPRSGWARRENVDPDARDPSLRRAHLALLRTRPLLQRLPFSNDRVGISLLGQAPGGKPLLAVTYVGSRRGAQNEVRRLVARLGERAQDYSFHYRQVP